MKKKTIILLALAFILTGCLGITNDKKIGKEFKNDYEAINGQANKGGKIHRKVELSEYNKFVETTPDEIVKMIENKETFYVYFGSRLCPWCRSVIEKADEVSRLKDIDKIYYIDIWDDEANEIFRDKYEINENGELVKTVEGTKEYYILLEKFSSFLRDYSITSDGKTIDTGEKRIYAPNFVYIEKGEIKKLTTGKSELQKDSREELTEQMLKDEEEAFDIFFVSSCSDSC